MATKTDTEQERRVIQTIKDRAMDKLFGDLKTDEEKSNFFLSGRGYETGVIAQAIQNDVAMAYHRCAEYKKELEALQSQDREDAERYRTVFDLLKILFEEWENGPACYNNSDRDEYLGNAFMLDDKTFNACVKALSIDHARRIEGEGE